METSLVSNPKHPLGPSSLLFIYFFYYHLTGLMQLNGSKRNQLFLDSIRTLWKSWVWILNFFKPHCKERKKEAHFYGFCWMFPFFFIPLEKEKEKKIPVLNFKTIYYYLQQKIFIFGSINYIKSNWIFNNFLGVLQQ